MSIFKIDYLYILIITVLVILCSGVPIEFGRYAGTELTIQSFVSVYGGWVTLFTAIALGFLWNLGIRSFFET